MTSAADPATPLQIDIWSDVVCPWCAIGKANFEVALAEFGRPVEIVWHSFELDPTAPAARSGDYVGMLAKKYGTTPERAEAMIDRVVDAGASVGLTFRFDIAQPGNTFDAHRMIHLGAARGIQTQVKERFLRGYMSEGRAIGLPEVVEELAIDAGLDPDEVAAVLASDAFAEDVRIDEATAAQLQVSGVPFFVVDRRYGVAGAQPPETLLQVLEAAWAEREPALEIIEGEVCGTDGCC